MSFIADLHIHSCFSRATSRSMNLENLYIWAQLKGIMIVGTGDFTHPKWFAELKKKLEPAEPGLFRLKKQFLPEIADQVPDSCRAPVRFLLSAEISTIYKKADKTRKVHSLILSPDFLAAAKLNAALQQMGNIASDGRPILGMDCKLLLQLTLDASVDNIFIPAHIWTPHFSVLGATSGFDSVEECFEELTPNIFALETGLSSDPSMNWRLSALDNFVLVSNSDAHSPGKLGREANIFNCTLSYFAMMKALQEMDHQQFLGTIEFFPEEGKYHFDGHRNCNIRLHPEETAAHNGRCPSCGKKVTIGVMHRVKTLADRREGFMPKTAFPYQRLIPLAEILSEIYVTTPGTKKVTRQYFNLLERFGNELFILRECSTRWLQNEGLSQLSHALQNMREGRVHITEGYDGQYGVIRVFEAKKEHKNQLSLFS